LYLKDVLEFDDSLEELKTRKRQQALRLHAWTTRVDSGNPVQLLDAKNYVKIAWEAIAPSTIYNYYIKAKIMSFEKIANEKIRSNKLEIDDVL
jgi:hypothetical protein